MKKASECERFLQVWRRITFGRRMQVSSASGRNQESKEKCGAKCQKTPRNVCQRHHSRRKHPNKGSISNLSHDSPQINKADKDKVGNLAVTEEPRRTHGLEGFYSLESNSGVTSRGRRQGSALWKWMPMADLEKSLEDTKFWTKSRRAEITRRSRSTFVLTEEMRRCCKTLDSVA
jgi:hypothetical protein